jgi:hypothetical protein
MGERVREWRVSKIEFDEGDSRWDTERARVGAALQ